MGDSPSDLPVMVCVQTTSYIRLTDAALRVEIRRTSPSSQILTDSVFWEGNVTPLDVIDIEHALGVLPPGEYRVSSSLTGTQQHEQPKDWGVGLSAELYLFVTEKQVFQSRRSAVSARIEAIRAEARARGIAFETYQQLKSAAPDLARQMDSLHRATSVKITSP